EKRVWDDRMHLVTYDVPETKRVDREALRDVIRQLGAGRLQDSVWITPYNPVDTLRAFIEQHRLARSVIVSDLGKDGAIGEEDLGNLVVRLWRLDLLNDRYEEWLREYKRSDELDQWLVTSYLTILRDDPQLPFPILPKWWKGDEAWRLVGPKVKVLYLALRSQS
ncbi:CRISPR-associated endonuclease Cas2, partial [Candidatus Gottesmanbacteria bacterium RIFCSPLOWO2_01_FULL_49_10]